MNWTNFPTIPLRDELPGDPVAAEKKIDSEPQLEHNLKSVLEVRTAGDPDEEEVVWTEFAPRQIAEKMAELGTPVSPHVVRVWLEEEGLALHKIAKVLAGGLSPDRDAQFQRIALLKAEYLDAGNPVFRSTPKRKSVSGNCIARVVCGRNTRSKRSTTTFPVGPTVW